MSRQPDRREISRRKFFTDFFREAAESQDDGGESLPSGSSKWKKYAAAGGVLAGAEAASRIGKGEFPNLVEVATKNADYRIFYGYHVYQADRREVLKSDALLLEGGTVDPERVKRIIKGWSEPRFMDQMLQILAEAKQRRIPVFLVDILQDSEYVPNLYGEFGIDVVVAFVEYL